MKQRPNLSEPYRAIKQLVRDLRDPKDGCPWDQEQTHESIIENLIEEAYELYEAIEKYNPSDSSSVGELKEELGDLLFQVIFHAYLAEEREEFTIDDIFIGIVEKLIFRHPHVYQNTSADNTEKVLTNWETIKREEKKSKSKDGQSMLEGIPKVLPALLKAYRMGQKISRVNFDWHAPDGTSRLYKKVIEEYEEMLECLPENPDDFKGSNLPTPLDNKKERATEELGDLLFVLAQLARHYHIDPELALQRANLKFQTRFQKMEKSFKKRLDAQDLPTVVEWEEAWQKVKKEEKS